MTHYLRRFGAVLGSVVVLGSLAACGASSSESSGDSVKPATQEQIDGYLTSTGKDVAALEKKLKSAYKKSHAFPASSAGLVTLSPGNKLRTYKPETDAGGAKVVRICVEHAEKQPDPNDTTKTTNQVLASTNTSVGFYPTGKAMEFKPGTSKGTGSDCQ